MWQKNICQFPSVSSVLPAFVMANSPYDNKKLITSSPTNVQNNGLDPSPWDGRPLWEILDPFLARTISNDN